MRHETKAVFPMGQEERKDEKIYLARPRYFKKILLRKIFPGKQPAHRDQEDAPIFHGRLEALLDPSSS
jgi:hypothetical protein